MKLKNWVLLIITGLFIYACGNTGDEAPESPFNPDLGKSYFFLEEGKYREYNVYEIDYVGIGESDTLRYQIREEVGDTFVSGGEVSRYVNRFRRENSSQNWELDSVWAARVVDGRAISVENNIPVVKMVFPADTSRRWDGNMFNGKPARVQRLKNFNTSFTVGLNTFLRTAEVELSNDDDFFSKRDFRREVYRDSIGLIYREYVVVDFCAFRDDPCYGQRIVQQGRLYREEIYAHGFIDE